MTRTKRLRLFWVVALLLGVVLTVPVRVGTVRPQPGDTQSAAIDAARVLLDQAIAREKAEPTKGERRPHRPDRGTAVPDYIGGDQSWWR